MTALPRALHVTDRASVALIGAPDGTVHFEFRVSDPHRLAKVREALARIHVDRH
ncbi:hypothetical protein [Nocardia blacklockiae]|uniref:hypothetical protein n=1 Tax=Nocardia blacklockiae TaxID=480036 RepID=UPI0018943388|nr:hypothetical protein [Nocardia blacklockiae]MBF6171814.1 hypothetical protein [Nocardia blacklockiae]